MLRISLDAQIEELEQHFETAHLNYLQQTAQRTHDFKELTQNDQRLSLEIEQKRKRIDNLQVRNSPCKCLRCMTNTIFSWLELDYNPALESEDETAE